MSELNGKHRAIIAKAAAVVRARGHEGDARLADSLHGIINSAAYRAPTDISNRLRDLAKRLVTPADCADAMRAGADEIERYYGGMVAWKKTAEKKDADWQAERMGRIDDRIAARQPATQKPYAWVNAGIYRQQEVYATLSVGPENPFTEGANAFPVYTDPPQPVQAELSDAQIATIIRDVAELPDRDSPADQPEMMLVSAEELRAILAAAKKGGN